MSRLCYSFLFLIFFPVFCFSQSYVVQGRVVSKINDEPIVGADVFYDGTSIGTLTDTNGFFELDSKTPINSPLVIQYMGYKTVLIQITETSFNQVYLEEAVTQLEGVVLEPDTWSRAKKMRIFKKEFLGRTNHRSSILNPEVIRLYYKASKKTLYAYADIPIEITNKKLGYKIKFHLIDFEVTFHNSEGALDAVHKSYYAGTSQFTDLEKDPDKRMIKLRNETYLGSLLHFFRSMYESRLTEEGYQLFQRGSIISENVAYSYQLEEGMLVAEQKIENLGVLYKGKSSLIKVITNPIFVDSYGIFLPPDSIEIGGVMGIHRVGSMLPADYAYVNNNVD